MQGPAIRITWKPEYAEPPHLFSLPHRANAVAENLGTEGPCTLHLFFCNSITTKDSIVFGPFGIKKIHPEIQKG